MSLTSVALSGEQRTNFIYVREGTLPSATIENLLNIYYDDSEIALDTSTLMLARFNNSLEAGTYETSGTDTVVGWDIYKQRSGETRLRFVCSIELNATQITDHFVENQVEYTYYLFPRGLSTMGSPLTADEVSSLCWNWVLYVAKETETDNVLTISNAYIFQGNVESGAMTNNSSSTVLNNFTQYPKVIKGTSNYKSGTLKSLIGIVDMSTNKYVESEGLRDALLALTTSNDRMFLKNRAGDIWEVTVYDAMTMEVNDLSSYQPNTANINWIEIASTSDISLIAESEE